VHIINLTPEVHLRWDCPVSEEENETHGQWLSVEGSTRNWRLHFRAVTFSFMLCYVILLKRLGTTFSCCKRSL
jgi:hypothetical protein